MNRTEIADRLKNAGIENYIFEAKIIEEHARKYNCDKIELEDMITRRENREPLQYILGEWEFYGDVYKLNSDCLIPRPETEFLTEYVITNAKQNAIILDLCSGTGCISISALKRRKDLTGILIDVSSGAVEISKENARINGVFDRINFYCFDIINDFEKILNVVVAGIARPPGLIVSNPPYLTKSEVEQIKTERTELYHEPETAFFGGGDGLDFYRFIINNYSNSFRNDTVTVFECGINQSKDIVEMFGEIGFSCDVICDYNKIERIVAGHCQQVKAYPPAVATASPFCERGQRKETRQIPCLLSQKEVSPQ